MIVSWHIWTYRALYLGLALVIITARLLPLNLGDSGLPAPDVLLALTLAWLLRQPAVVPIGSIVVVFLLADFLFQKPPGLFTCLVLLVTESVKSRRAQMTEVNFLVEWASVAGTVFTLLILERVALWVLFLSQDPLGLTLVHGLLTVAVYPLVVLVSHFLLGMRKLRPMDAEAV
ncbi:rod shape-determining protein MreD [Rhodobacterales bacterium HKCCE2091]|nr:rod shape-determining protein MreD [Rhodobacterales bacterium HKCCE2091]